MSQILGTVVAAKITTGDTVNTFPIGDQNEMQGGQHSVADLTARDAITQDRRVEGMTCWVVSENQAYRLVGGTTNGDWEVVTADGPVAYAAYSMAETGTNTGSAAYALSLSGTSVANAGYALALTGTSVADAAYAMAQIGTVIPYLGELQDVNIPTPFVNQVLAFDGSLWIAKDTPSQVAPGAFSLYLEDTSSGTSGYSNLRSTPSGLPEDADLVSVGGGTPFVFAEGYLSNYVNRTVLDAGVWEFNTYSAVSNGVQSAQIVIEAYLLAINGAETLIFSGTTDPVSSTSVTLSSLISTQGTFNSALTDKLLLKYYWLRTNSPSVTATIWHSGSEHASHVHTPIGYAHNDLGGIQGGATDQRYHVTLDQNGALAGSTGYPSSTNRFVTNEDPRLVGPEAFALAERGTNIAQAAYDLTQSGTNIGWSAYGIAQIGTNTGTAAYDLASAAYTLASAGRAETGVFLISGGNAIWTAGYTFSVQPTLVDFRGSLVSYPLTSVTLPTSDPLDNRLDLIVADQATGSIFSITGTASTPPAPPDYDPVTQFQLTFIPVDANTSQYLGATRTWVYQEHLEWTYTDNTVNLNPDSITDPYEGAKAIEGTVVASNNYFQLAAPAPFLLTTYDTLYLYLKPKAAWGSRYLRLEWRATSGGARVGNYVSISNGSFGFNSSTSAYQLIAIPLSAFGVPGSTTVQALRATAISSAGTFGFFIDNIGLQIGVTQPTTSVPDATTTTKGIVRLALDGETSSSNAVQGNDYRLALAMVGTNLGSAAYSLAVSGTTVANAVAADLNADEALFNYVDGTIKQDILDIEGILGVGLHGTIQAFTSDFRGGNPSTKISIIDGVVVGMIHAKNYSVEDFDNLSGTVTSATYGYEWAGTGTITPFNGQYLMTMAYLGGDNMTAYSTGTIYSMTGTNFGTSTGTIIPSPYTSWCAEDTFETYGTGTAITSFDGGFGWTTNGTVALR